MKKLFTILTVVALTTTISFAQAQFGGVVGFNSSAIASSDDNGLAMEDGRMGICLGGTAHFPLGDAMQLRTGLIYSQKGASETASGVTTTLKLDYLEIPIDFAYMLGDGGFALSGGPYIAFAMNKSIETDPAVDALTQAIWDVMADELIGGMDFGLNFGASYTIGETYMIGAKYGMGLMDILDEDPPAGTTDEAWINGSFSVSFSYMFGG